nr:PREDICTED: protein FAM217A isoform X6 [Latimeria chalumnae]|eukprot:XP_014350807.1 PREDICTED: protein FAM217A isoform X6 [Latimeria chalumnae]
MHRIRKDTSGFREQSSERNNQHGISTLNFNYVDMEFSPTVYSSKATFENKNTKVGKHLGNFTKDHAMSLGDFLDGEQKGNRLDLEKNENMQAF